MHTFPILNVDSAPEASKPVLRQLESAFGMIPNIAGAMANSPTLINGFTGIFRIVHAGSFTEAQIQTLLLTNAVTNRCAWAVAFHSFLALKEGLDPVDVEAMRERRAPSDSAHAALSVLARSLIEKRGRLEDQDLDTFIEAGFSKEQVLEVIAVSAASTITNYVGNVANPPLDAQLQNYRWNG